MTDSFLVEAVKRASLFEQLADGPYDVPELVDDLEMSRSTVHRSVQSFLEKDLLRETDDGLELTGLGRCVGEAVADFQARADAAAELGSFLNTAEPTAVDVPLEVFADATAIHPKPRQPHFAVKRIIELIERSESVRIFSSIISPFYVDVAYREMMEGTDIEVIFDQEVIEIIATEYTEKAVEAAATGQFDVRVRESLPFELFVFDDRMGMAAHDDDGIARVFVESDAPEAVEWAEQTYDRYRESAERIDVSSF